MSFLKTTIISAAALLIAQPLAAQDVEFDVTLIKDKDEVTLDRAKAYILLETPGQNISTFIKMPTAEEQASWESQRAEALVEAQEDHVKDLKRYERRIKNYKPGPGQGRAPVEPIVPTEENFTWPDIERSLAFTVGPLNRFSKDDGTSLYLHEVPAGEYFYYSNGPFGLSTCACMGTVSFQVAAGKVTAVRTAYQLLNAQGEPVDEAEDGVRSADRAVRVGMIVEGPSDAALDPRIPADMFTVAELSPMAGVPNWAGGEINRVMAIPGLFTYERGEMVDLRGE